MPVFIDLQVVQHYVTDLYNNNQKQELVYHNLHHTKDVVQRCYEIAGSYSLPDTEMFVLITAAWFHDTGQLFGTSHNHEEKSVVIIKDFFEEKNISEETIINIKNCIMATKLTIAPSTLLQEILCDADTYNLGTDEFSKTDKLVKKEVELRSNTIPQNWDQMTLALFDKHTFYTKYCKEKLIEGKQKNRDMVAFRCNLNQ